MTKFRLLLAAFILTTMAIHFTGCTTTEVDISGYAPPPPPPVTVKYLKRTKGTPPYRNYYFEITITNPNDQPTWFVLPYNGEVPLNDDEIFSTISNKVIPFKSDRLDGGAGKATRIFFKGKDKFYAFCIVGKGTLRLKSFSVMSQRRFKEFEVWEAKGIYVNSKTPLKDWLPYNVVCEKDVTIPANPDEFKTISLDLNRKGTRQRTDYPKEPVNHVWIQRSDYWKIPFTY